MKKVLAVLRIVVPPLLILAVGGFAVFFVSVFLFFGLVPLYVAKVFPVLAGFLVLYWAALSSGKVPKRWSRRVLALFLVLVVGSVGYMGVGLYNDSIPIMDNRESLIYEYLPFGNYKQEGTKAVVLEEPSALKFEDTPIRMDGATALYPIYSAFVQAVYPEGEYDLYRDERINDDDPTNDDFFSDVTCSGTTTAYERLIKGWTDVIFCAAPSQDQLDMAAAAGLELHLTPIGREAFVFFVNSQNPVEGLTVEEIQKIYTGEITNWRQVGGKWQKIRPYQRDENSGSQSALLRLMDGLPLLEPETEDRIGGMGGIITQVASYRNHKNAIGFTFRFYSTEMVQNDQIKLLALNGVAPTRDTIRDGSYPIASNFYAITASPIGEPAPEESNGDLRAFLDWILGPQGQWIIEQTGYVGVG